MDDLKLQLAPDGIRHGSFELILVAYDADGKPLNMVTQDSDVLLKPKFMPPCNRLDFSSTRRLTCLRAKCFCARASMTEAPATPERSGSRSTVAPHPRRRPPSSLFFLNKAALRLIHPAGACP